MARRTHIIGDVKLNVVETETERRHIALIQGQDVIILSMDQAGIISDIIDKA